MKIYVVSFINNDHKSNEHKTITKYFLNELEAIKYLEELHDCEFCFEEIGNKKKCPECNWKKGLNNMLCLDTDFYLNNNIFINIIETDNIKAKGLEIEITSNYGKRATNKMT